MVDRNCASSSNVRAIAAHSLALRTAFDVTPKPRRSTSARSASQSMCSRSITRSSRSRGGRIRSGAAMLCGVELSLFDEVAEAVRGMAPSDLGTCRARAHAYGVKLWFGPATAPREHYEAQVIGPEDVKRAKVLAIEVGFHSE